MVTCEMEGHSKGRVGVSWGRNEGLGSCGLCRSAATHGVRSGGPHGFTLAAGSHTATSSPPHAATNTSAHTCCPSRYWGELPTSSARRLGGGNARDGADLVRDDTWRWLWWSG